MLYSTVILLGVFLSIVYICFCSFTGSGIGRHFHTSGYDYNYLHHFGIDVFNTSNIAFQVQGCLDAHIALSQYIDDYSQETYEVVIGGSINTVSVIRDCSLACRARQNKWQVALNCTEFRHFWISWANRISVGSGSVVGADMFMEWEDLDPHPVNYIAISSYAEAVAEWIF